ncbi:MAG: class I SAM-dependent RNA methyltransferase, partial [Candidatus Kapabacteria bacterium]|nr:class I SAM-dependent RNA methyltransferase [Candidatus Kapabacteria bacterium]
MVSTIQLTCPKFIPPVLAKELESLGYPVKEIGTATVSTEGTLDDAMRLNLHMRTAHRVVYLLKEFRAASPTDLYNEALNIEWEEFIPADGYISVVSAVDNITITNSQFANQRLKDAIVDRMRNKNGVRPQSGPDRSKCVAFLYWKDSRVLVYLDTTGLPLTKRGYRTNPHTAPMNEV